MNWESSKRILPHLWEERADELWQNDILATDGLVPSAYDFHCCVERYDGNYKVKSFSCWDQFLTLAFAQLTYRESLRDIEACLRAAPPIFIIWVFEVLFRATLWPTPIKYATGEFTPILLIYSSRKARKLYNDEPFGIELDQTVYALDTTTIDLCLSLFPWAQFRRHKSAVKLHTCWICAAIFLLWLLSRVDRSHESNPRSVDLGGWSHLSDGSRLCRFS